MVKRVAKGAGLMAVGAVGSWLAFFTIIGWRMKRR